MLEMLDRVGGGLGENQIMEKKVTSPVLLGIAGTIRDSTTPSRLSNLYSDLILMPTLMMLMTMMSVVMMTVIML